MCTTCPLSRRPLVSLGSMRPRMRRSRSSSAVNLWTPCLRDGSSGGRQHRSQPGRERSKRRFSRGPSWAAAGTHELRCVISYSRSRRKTKKGDRCVLGPPGQQMPACLSPVTGDPRSYSCRVRPEFLGQQVIVHSTVDHWFSHHIVAKGMRLMPWFRIELQVVPRSTKN